MSEEVIAGRTKRRKPLVAIVLSLVEPGLGHIYCGRIVKGIILAFLSGIFVPVIFTTSLVSQTSVKITIVVVSVFVSLVIWLFAIIDSWHTARHTAADYTLKDYNRWYLYAIFIIASMFNSRLLSSYVKETLVEAFRVTAASDYPTVIPRDRILANKIAYKNKDPKRGDLVVFTNPEDRCVCWIKRVVAVAGDTVEIKDNELYINDQKLERQKLPQSIFDNIRIDVEGKPLVGEVFEEINDGVKYKIFLAEPPNDPASPDFSKITVPPYHCFVLGDNRNISRDSRHFGSIPLGIIKGRVDYLYWPAKDWSRFGKIEN